MGRASTLSLHERDQIKVLSTAGYTMKRIADVNSERTDKLNNRKKDNFSDSVNEIRGTCGIDTSETTVWRMLDKYPNIVRSRMKKCPQLTQRHKDERLCWAKIFMRCGWEKVRLLRVFKNKPIN
uniref:HTH_Tnp_Tc3_1 domain-containing protein n=1 Tax=Heterorhabditis bacteriophora TaxID=37862 RepID=A0A1I7X303_HETBA